MNGFWSPFTVCHIYNYLPMVFSGVKYRVTDDMGHYCCLAALNHAHITEIMVLAERISMILSSSCWKTLVNEFDNRIKVVPGRKDLSCNNLNWIIKPIGISFLVSSSIFVPSHLVKISSSPRHSSSSAPYRSLSRTRRHTPLRRLRLF